MKETKKFFTNNRLNRGQKRSSNIKQSDVSVIRKEYKHILPPIDILEHYEEIYPGTLEKLLFMAEKEQNHRHSIDLSIIERHARSTHLGRIFSLIFIAIVSSTTLGLSIIGNYKEASIFAISSFLCISLVSYLYSKNIPVKEKNKTFDKKHKNHIANKHPRQKVNSPNKNI